MSAEPGRGVASEAEWTHPVAAERADISQHDLDVLLSVATLYISAFAEDEMTLPEKLRLQEVEEVVERYGRRY